MVKSEVRARWLGSQSRETADWSPDIFGDQVREAGKMPTPRSGLPARAPNIGPFPRKWRERRGASLLVAANVSSL